MIPEVRGSDTISGRLPIRNGQLGVNQATATDHAGSLVTGATASVSINYSVSTVQQEPTGLIATASVQIPPLFWSHVVSLPDDVGNGYDTIPEWDSQCHWSPFCSSNSS